MAQGDPNQMRSQSQDKTKLAFKARLDQKATHLAQDDSNLPHNGTHSLGQQQNQLNFKNQANNKKGMKNEAQNHPQIKPPRTGIEQPFLRDRPRFKDVCKEFEPIHQYNASMSDEYARLEAEKGLKN